MRGPFRDVQEESGSGTDLAGRHDTQRETPQHDRACRATTPKNMTVRASDGTPARHRVVALVVHSTVETPPEQEQGGETRTRSHHFRAVVWVWIPLASRLCNPSAKYTCHQWLTGIGYR